MKKSTKFLLLIIMGFVLTLASCIEEGLDDPFADPVDKFLGTWQCNETEVPPEGLWVYNVIITRNPQNSTEILIANFNYQGNSERARAIVAGTILTIPTQRICDNTIEIKGNGSFSQGQVTINYSTNDGADLKNFNAKLTKP